jgi:hypothetical protein
MSIDTDHRLPKKLVRIAAAELERHGMILADTAALLIEAGAFPADVEKQVWAQANMMEVA